MDFFKPIWQKKDPRKIRKFIDSTNDQEMLSKIVLNCISFDMKDCAAAKMTAQVKCTTMLEANKQGNSDAIKAIMRTEPLLSLRASTLFQAVVKSGDLELLSLFALRRKYLSEWNECKAEFQILLDAPGFDEVKKHYAELKENAEREVELIKKQNEENRKAEANERRREAERKKRDAFLIDPRETLSKAAGKPSEKNLWIQWFDYWLPKQPDRVFYELTHNMRDLEWSSFFPVDQFEHVLLRSAHRYDKEGYFRSEEAEKDISIFLNKLYSQRAEAREAICLLNGLLYFEGRKGSTVNFGDHHEALYVDIDPVPPYRLSVSISALELEIHLIPE